MTIFLWTCALIAVSLMKHLSLQRSTLVKESGPIGTSIFVGMWVGAASIAILLLPQLGMRDIFLKDVDMLLEQPVLLSVVLFKGGIVLAILLLKQILAHRRQLQAYAYSSLIGIASLAIVNSFFGEQLTTLQWFSAIGLTTLGVVFTFTGDLAKRGRVDQLIFVAVVLISTAPAMTDNIMKGNISWFTSFVLSNVVLLSITLLISLYQGKLKEYTGMAFTNQAAVIAGSCWLLFEMVVLYVMFEQLPVTVTEMGRNLYIPILMVLSAYVFNEKSKQEKREAARSALTWGTLSYLIAMPMMF